MKFDSVSSSIPDAHWGEATRKLTALLLELGVRENNSHVGSGLGGNNFQMLALLQMKHHLVKSVSPITIKGDDLYWDVDALLNYRRGALRKEIDGIFPFISEGIKYLGVALHANVNHPDKMIESLSASTLGSFGLRTVTDVLNGNKIDLSSFSYASQVIVACMLCTELCRYLALDPQTNKTHIIGEALSTATPEVFLISVRKCIGIDRIIDFNLDEHPMWSDAMTRISKEVD